MRHRRRLAIPVSLVVLSLPHAALAQNFAPIADGSAPDQAVVGAAVPFSSAASVDPDSSPQPLSFRWDFGDGAFSDEPSPSHVFTAAGAYPVTLTVSDGADTALDVLIVHVLARPLAQPPSHSSPIAIARDGSRLFVANPDSGSISVLSTAGGVRLLREHPVCRGPRTLTTSSDGALVYVTCQGERSIAILDVASGQVSRLATGAEPYGVAALPDGGLLVTNQGDGSVTRIAADLGANETWPSGADARALAVSADGTRAFVTTYRSRGESGGIIVHDLVARTSVGTITLADDPGPDTASSGRGVLNLLSVAVIAPAGDRLWIGGLKANTAAGLYQTGAPIASVNWLRGVATPVDLAAPAENLQRRIDTNDADSVSGIAFSADGRYGYFTHQGAGALSIYDLSKATLFDPGAGASVPFEARIDVGDAPHGIVIAPAGDTVYVTNYLGRDVVAVDVRDPRAPTVIGRVTVTVEPLAREIIEGKRLFYRSREPAHSQSNYVACASCHPDGGMSDGQVWDLTQDGEGLRNTIDLRGRAGLGHGPLHWSANFDEIQDFENPIVRLFGGTGLAGDGAPPNPPLGAPNAGRSEALDNLAAYVTSLAYTPASPYRNADGSLTDAATRGEALFGELGCVSCHPPPAFTRSALGETELIDVGTLGPASGRRLGAALTGVDVPGLIGLWDGAPYFHDGSAPTLRDVFRGRPDVLEARLTAGLDDAQLDDLLAYLSSLDAPEPDLERPPASAAGCGCGGASSPRASAGLLIAGLVLRRRRRTGAAAVRATHEPGAST